MFRLDVAQLGIVFDEGRQRPGAAENGGAQGRVALGESAHGDRGRGFVGHHPGVGGAVDQAGVLRAPGFPDPGEHMIAPAFADRLTREQHPQVVAQHVIIGTVGTVEDVLDERWITGEHDSLVMAAEAGDVVENRVDVDSGRDHGEPVTAIRERRQRGIGISAADPVSHRESDHDQRRRILRPETAEYARMQFDAFLDGGAAARPVRRIPGGPTARRPHSGRGEIAVPHEPVERIALQVVRFGDDRQGREVVVRADSGDVYIVLGQEIGVRRHRGGGAMEQSQCPVGAGSGA